MSKIFEILNGSSGELADLVRPVIHVEQSPTAEAEAPAVAAPLPPAEIRVLNLRIPAPSPLLPFENGQWRPSEQYRILRTKLGQHGRQPRLIVISSAASGDGKTVNAINLAAALSLKNDAQVLLVDADFRKPAMHTRLGIPESPGLTEVLRGASTLEKALVRTREFPNLCVLAGGTPAEHPVELLDSEAWPALCGRLRGLFRYVVLDSPPVGAVADYDLIEAVCDGVILVVRPDHTNRDLCKTALGSVPKGKLLGVLLNCVPDWSLARHAGSHYYYYSGEKGPAAQ